MDPSFYFHLIDLFCLFPPQLRHANDGMEVVCGCRVNEILNLLKDLFLLLGWCEGGQRANTARRSRAAMDVAVAAAKKYDNFLASPFKGRPEVELYSYGYIVFDMKTHLVNIRVFGAPKIHDEEGATPYRLRQGNATTWILYKYVYHGDDEKKYKECALFVFSKGRLGFSIYETTISPGIDPVFVTLVLTILDNFWTNRLKKARVKFY
jgi:hypothetical protein